MKSEAKADPGAAAAGALSQIAMGLLASRGGDLSYGTLKGGFRELVKRDPLDALLVTVFGGAYLFYLAEKDTNPKCQSIWDAVVFISTSLSVGYDDVFARTTAGKAIASFVMTVGPAMATAALDPPAAEKPEPTVTVSPEALELERSILGRLDSILEVLKGAPAAGKAGEEGPATPPASDEPSAPKPATP